MNWQLLEKMGPIVFRIVKTIYEGLRDKVDDEEIRRRVADPSVILSEELDALRAAEDDLEDYIRTGH